MLNYLQLINDMLETFNFHDMFKFLIYYIIVSFSLMLLLMLIYIFILKFSIKKEGKILLQFIFI